MKIRLSLNEKDISSAVKQLERYRDRVSGSGQAITSALVDRGVDLAKENAMYMNAYDKGDLVNGIVGEKEEGRGVVKATAPHSAYVEFGTGIRGANSPHPNPGLAGWKYDVNEHGEEGWWYWKDGEWHWTAGMQSRPFMYQTAQQLAQEAPAIARAVLSAGGRLI